MLSEQEESIIRSELSRYPDRRAMVPEALRIVQEHRGWISDESLADVAGCLGLGRDVVDSIATSYNMIFRRPVGRHVLLVCDNVSCWIMGSDALTKAIGERCGIEPGETSEGGRFTLLPSGCLGACHHAPAMMVDDELHGPVSAARLDELLEGCE